MKDILQSSIVLAAASLLLAQSDARAGLAYTIGNNGSALVSFDLATPGITTMVGTVSGAVSLLQGIDFRPADGLLYGFGTGGEIVTIDPNTAATTLVSTSTVNSLVGELGIDFNPVADRLRLVNQADQNLRINVANGVATVDGVLAYAALDPNFGANPSIIDVAYTNSDTNAGTGTTLYYLDNNLDILVSTTNPNGGVLNTIGALGFDTTDRTGFDILSDGFGGNTAYALLTAPSGIASLHSINLVTGAATNLGTISQTAGSRPYGLAVVQPVPEPGTSLFGLALVGAAFTRRCSRRRA